MRSLNGYHLLFSALLLGGVFVLFLFPSLWKFFLGPAHAGTFPLYPFLDMHGRLAAFEAHRAGVDILHHPNPLDPLRRVNIKPTWPLGLSFLGLGREHLALAGFATVAGFLGIVVSILRPRRVGEAVWLLLIAFSPPILLGIERANDDLVYFILLSAVPVLMKWHRSPGALAGAWLLIFILAPAKYYPGAVFLLFLYDVGSLRRVMLLLGAGVLFVALYSTFKIDEILYLKDAVPQPEVFLAHGVGLVPGLGGLGLVWLLGTALLGLASVAAPRWPAIRASAAAQRWFLFGFSVGMFCYSLNTNFDYRLVYVLPMLVLLLEIGRNRSENGIWSKVAVGMSLSLVPVVWLDIGGMHLAMSFDFWGREVMARTMALKSSLLLLFYTAAAVLAATVLRPNVRRLVGQAVGRANHPCEI